MNKLHPNYTVLAPMLMAAGLGKMPQ